MELSTLCYLERDEQYLMLHRTVKKNDVNKEKWIGVGGHFEEGESPEECLLREVYEETGLVLTADGFEGEMHACDEGELAWVDRDRITDLNIWEGDKIFLSLLRREAPFFSLKLVYDGGSRLVSASLDGKELAL